MKFLIIQYAYERVITIENYYIYRLLDKNNKIIYIGRTDNLDSLFLHTSNLKNSNYENIPEACYLEVHKVEFVKFKNEFDQIVYKTILISEFKPEYNKAISKGQDIKLETPDFIWTRWSKFTEKYKNHILNQINKIQTLDSHLLGFINDLTASGQSGLYLQTGFSEVDRKLMIKGSNVIVLSGLSGMGKTDFALNISINLVKKKKKVLYISIKDDLDSIIKKIVSRESAVAFNKLTSRKLTKKELEAIILNVGKLKDSSLFLSDVLGIKEIVKNIELNDFDFVVIDDFSMIENQDGVTTSDRTHDTLKRIREVTIKAKVPVLIIKSLPTDIVDDRADHRPLISDLTSNSFISLSDIIIFLYRDEIYHLDTDKKSILEVIIAKNKFGTETIELEYIPQNLKISNVDKGKTQIGKNPF